MAIRNKVEGSGWTSTFTSVLPKTLLFIGIAALLVIQIYPVVWIFLASVKSTVELSSTPFSFPQTPTFQNYVRVIGDGKFLIYFFNSFRITAISVSLVILLGATVGFSLAKFGNRFSKKIYAFFVAGLLVPVQITLIPLFVFYSHLHVLNSDLSLILPQVGFALPLAVMMFVSFYYFVPDELIEAAVMDGASAYRIFGKVIFPLSINTVITVGTMYFILIWNDFIFANTFITEDIKKTIAVGLKDYVGAFGNVDWGLTYAAIAISIVPPLLLNFLLNDKVSAGMTLGAVKG